MLERLEGQNTKGRTMYQFRQVIEEAIVHANRYGKFMISKFKDEVVPIEGKRMETDHIIAGIEKATKAVATAKFGKCQAAWVRKLCILKQKYEKNRTTKEEMAFYHQFVAQVSLAKSTAEHLNELVNKHRGDAKHELHKALK